MKEKSARELLEIAIKTLEERRERAQLIGEKGDGAIRGALLRYEAFENEIRSIITNTSH
jgi:hypothetical protein